MNKFNDDFEYFWGLIDKGDNFTFSRYADGEVMLMKGVTVGTNTQAFKVDKWSAPNNITKVGVELLKTLNHTENNYHYAISGKNDNIDDYNFLVNNITQGNERLTFVNLWINANYNKMKEKLNTVNRDVVLICNYRAKNEEFPFKITNLINFPDNCIEYWETRGDEYINNLINTCNNYENKLFLISCGPVSEIIIHELYNNNPNNTYIDVGSSIDELVHGSITRPYMNKDSMYANMISKF
jgi:hypothetical protein